MIKNEWIKRACTVVLMAAAVLLMNAVTVFAEDGTEGRDTSFSEEELEYIETCPELKVGYVCDRLPVSFRSEDGELAGISRNIFDRISEISGLQFTYVELPTGSVTYDYLLEEGFDFVTSVEYNKENQKARGILISDPYLSSRKVIVAKEHFHFDSNSHFKVAISTGSQTIKKVLAEYNPNFELIDYPSTEDCFDAVSKGEADLLIQNQYVVEYWLYKPMYDNLKVFPIIEMSDQLCFSAVTPLDKEDNEIWKEKELQISVINKSIAQMSEGEVAGYIITSITENMYRYTAGDLLYQYRYTLLIVGIALILIGILLYLNYRIRIRSIHDRADARAKGAFLSTMSHEIRTPLNGLIGLHYMMSRHLDDRKKMEDYLKQSSSVAKYLLSLVNNILDMSKIQDSGMELEHKPVDLAVLLSMTEAMERGSMEEKGLRFVIDAEIPYPVILGDEMRIQQILINLLDNARKYTSEGGDVTVKLRQTLTADNQVQTTIVVTDTGRGISVEFQKKIFEPFTQERTTVSRGNQGTGLGMAISSLLAKSINGSLQVKSKLGEGSCFTFEFTAEQTELPAGASVPAEVEEKSAAESVKPRILIAEDNELNSQILTELLTEAGFETAHAPDGKQAFEMFRASAPREYGVILMDLMMPGMDGFVATRRIRELERPDATKVRIIACTANSFKEDRDKAFESGMDDFIAKPIDIRLLIQKLEQCSVEETSETA